MAEVLDDQLVIFIDLLGFSEFSTQSDTELQNDVLHFLTAIASLKNDFLSITKKTDTGSETSVRPSISTFSDHIIASYALHKIDSDDDHARALIVLSHMQQLVSAIALMALRLGFLIRGGVAFGKLYHSGGVVFGPALIEAVALESRSASYPRIVLSSRADALFKKHREFFLEQDFDGMSCVDYYRDCILKASAPGHRYPQNIDDWFSYVTNLLKGNLDKLAGAQRAKWFYFTEKIRSAVDKLGPEVRDAFGLRLESLPDSRLKTP